MNVSQANRTQRSRHCGDGSDQQSLVKFALEQLVLRLPKAMLIHLNSGTSLGLRPAITTTHKHKLPHHAL